MQVVFLMGSSGEGTREGVVFDEVVVARMQNEIKRLGNRIPHPTVRLDDTSYRLSRLSEGLEERDSVGVAIYRAWEHLPLYSSN